MKIYQDDLSFNPVTITFETAEEFETFMSLLDFVQNPTSNWSSLSLKAKELVINISNEVSTHVYY
jgi:hypothetical protein